MTQSENDAHKNANEISPVVIEIRALSERLDNHAEILHKGLRDLRTDFLEENKAAHKTAFWTALGLSGAVLWAFVGLFAWQSHWMQTQNNLWATTMVAIHATSPTVPTDTHRHR